MGEVFAEQIGLSFLLSVLLLVIVYNACGYWLRRSPQYFFALGIIVTVAGVGIIFLVEITMEMLGSAPFKDLVGEPDELIKFAKFIKSTIEIGFAAVGAGMIALSMDVRSERKLEEEIDRHNEEQGSYDLEYAEFQQAPPPTTAEDKIRRSEHEERLEKWKSKLDRKRKFLLGK